MLITIIEDNVTLAKGIAHKMRDEGHAVNLIHDGAQALEYLQSENSDLIILDINLPSMSGIEVLKSLRLSRDNTPVLLLTANSETKDRVNGLDAGADDYLVKPFEMDELSARIRALLRRKLADTPVLEKISNITFDRGARSISLDGNPIDLPRREIAVFECLLDRKEQLVSKATLANHLYGVGSEIEEKVIEVYVSRLRKKLISSGIEIKAARGLGYMMKATS